jgi:hypothetical protein
VSWLLIRAWHMRCAVLTVFTCGPSSEALFCRQQHASCRLVNLLACPLFEHCRHAMQLPCCLSPIVGSRALEGP